MKKLILVFISLFYIQYISAQKYMFDDEYIHGTIEISNVENDSLSFQIIWTNQTSHTIAVPFEDPEPVITSENSLYLNIGINPDYSANAPIQLKLLEKGQSMKREFKVKGGKSVLMLRINYVPLSTIKKKLMKWRDGRIEIYFIDYYRVMKWNEMVLPICNK